MLADHTDFSFGFSNHAWVVRRRASGKCPPQGPRGERNRWSPRRLDSAEEAERLLETCVQTDLRPPVQQLLRLGGIHGAPRLLSGLGRAVLRRQVPAGDLSQQLVEFVHAGLDARAHIVGTVRSLALEGEDSGAGDIPDVDVVPGLLTGAVDTGGPVRGQVPGEYGHYPGLPVRVLARTVDVGVAQRRVGDAVLDAVVVQVALPGQLRDPVGRDRVLGMVLRRGELLLLSVDRPTSRGED